MAPKSILYGTRIVVVTGIFAAGYLCGTVTEHRADAQMGDLGGQLMEKAAGSGGIVGSAAQLGSTIGEMQKNVNGLQKNLETLRKVKAALSGK